MKEDGKIYKLRPNLDSDSNKSILSDGPINFDFEPIDFDDRALAEGKQEPYDTYRFQEEHTLCLIKPIAVKCKHVIFRRIYEEGFTVLKTRTLCLSPEQLSDFYEEHYGKPWFPKFIVKMSRGSIVVAILAKDNAVQDFRNLIGPAKVSKAKREAPNSLRAMFGLRGDRATNGLHGSNSIRDAKREIRFFFPQVAIIEPIPDLNESLGSIQEHFINVILKGLVELNNTKPGDPLTWLSEWLLNVKTETPTFAEGIITVSDKILDVPTKEVEYKCPE